VRTQLYCFSCSYCDPGLTGQSNSSRSRIKFEEAQLAGTRERLAKLRATVDRETTNISDTLEIELEALREEIAVAEREVDKHRDRLNALKKDMEAATTTSEAARKELSKAVKALDEVQKDINEWVSPGS